MSAFDSNAFYFVKDGVPACVLVYGGEPFPPERYSEVEPPAGVRDTSCRLYKSVWTLVRRIASRTGVNLRGMPETDWNGEPAVFVGRTDRSDFSLLGEATGRQFAVAEKDGNLFPIAQTPRGMLDAAYHVLHGLRFSEDGKNAWLPAEALGIFERDVPETVHAFPRFTLSFYGPPYIHMPDPADWLKDEKIFGDILAFGADEVPLYAFGQNDPEKIGAIRALIRRFSDHGVRVRLYGVDDPDGSECFFLTRSAERLREAVRRFVERYGDLDGISEWGFADEPEPEDVPYCAAAKAAFREFDPKKRPVYINLGPRAHCRGVQNFYDRIAGEIDPDYYCLDRYPFFMTDRGPAMTDAYFYAHLELNRNYALDYGRDCGLILAAIRVGADPARADMNEDFMRWQTNFLLAYGGRYLEQYVYYHVHDCCMLGEGNEPTFRWHLAKRAGEYVKAVGALLENARLDAVFHLPRPDGTYDIDTIPYYGYRGVGPVRGVDAALSFFDDGTLLVTDKRCCPADGEEHEITLTGLDGSVLLYDVPTARWKNISDCPAAKPGEDGLTLTLSRASQFILRNAGGSKG